MPSDCDSILVCLCEGNSRILDAHYVGILLPHQLLMEYIEKWIRQYPKCVKIEVIPIKLNSKIKVLEKGDNFHK